MKKMLALILILAMNLTLYAGYHRSYAMGFVTELRDEYLVDTYPALVQQFDNQIHLGTTGATWIIGGLYKHSKMLGLAGAYTSGASTRTFNFEDPFLGGSTYVVDYTSHAALTSWGGVLGNFKIGAGLRNTFAADLDGSGFVKSTTFLSNGNETDFAKASGFITELTPSAAFNMGNMKIWASLPLTLNFMKVKEQVVSPGNTNLYELKPAFFDSIGADVHVSIPLSKTVT
ncbi:MAG TPA: hypothetical protein VKS21_11540, partial [Spirochaetota bacterium]|nr:hypothetical protein [Spirochaetota bacterium]